MEAELRLVRVQGRDEACSTRPVNSIAPMASIQIKSSESMIGCMTVVTT